MMSETWRTVQFTYRVPEDADFNEIETQMIEACAALIGCECDDTTERCAADWVGSGGPIEAGDVREVDREG